MADPTFTTDGLGTDGIVIRTVGNDLILAGGAPRGTLYAVYSFLEDYVGCHWWTSKASTIPKKPTLKFEALEVRYVPRIEYRTMQYIDARDDDFSVRNKLNGDWQHLFTDDGFHNARENPKLGGRIRAFHKWIRWIRGVPGMMIDRHLYLPDHPEWFAALPKNKPASPYMAGSGPDGLPSMESGELIRPQSLEDLDKPPFAPLGLEGLCMTNQDMIKECAKNTKMGVIWSPIASWADASQPDGDNCCRCPDCMAVARAEGSYSGLTIGFANAIADELAKNPATNIPVRTMAYHMTKKPPLHVKPRDNVFVTLEIGCFEYYKPDQAEAAYLGLSYSHPLTDPRNKSAYDDLVGWGKITRHLYIWDYICNAQNYLVPWPNLKMLSPNMKAYVDNNVTGVMQETYMDFPGTELAELRAWVVSKLMWNPNLDGWKLAEEFCHGYYGPAGDEVFAYLGTMHDAVAASGDWLDVGSGPHDKYLTFDTLSASWKHLKAAEKAVESSPELRFRVQVAQMPVMHTFMVRWDEMRKVANAEGKPWPFSDSMSDTFDRFVKIAKRVGMINSSLEPTGDGPGPPWQTAEMSKLAADYVARANHNGQDLDSSDW